MPTASTAPDEANLELYIWSLSIAPAVGHTGVYLHVPCGLVVRISGFHPGGRGSIPRTGVHIVSPSEKSAQYQIVLSLNTIIIIYIYIYQLHRNYFY